MSTTITTELGDSTTPELVLGYEAGRRSRNIIHELVGGGILVSVIAPDYRTGTLQLFYTTEASAFHAQELHATPGTFELACTERPSLDMFYVLGDGEVTITLDEETREVWTVAVPFQEVSPL